MIILGTTYSLVPQNDPRTGLSLGLSFAAILATIIVFGILAHHGYISHTVAYSATPTIGAALLLIGSAIALIRKENRPPTPSSIPQSIDQSTPLGLQAYANGAYIKICAPDETRPYWFCVAQLSDGDEVEVDYFTEETIYFIRDNNQESKPLAFTTTVERELELCTQTINKNNYLNRLNYRWLMEEQVGAMHIGRGSAHFFTGASTTFSNTSYSMKFCISNLDPSQPYDHHKDKITFILKKGSPPVRSLQGLEKHKEVIEKLQAIEWTWYCPGQITEIKEFGTKAFEVCYTYNS